MIKFQYLFVVMGPDSDRWSGFAFLDQRCNFDPHRFKWNVIHSIDHWNLAIYFKSIKLAIDLFVDPPLNTVRPIGHIENHELAVLLKFDVERVGFLDHLLIFGYEPLARPRGNKTLLPFQFGWIGELFKILGIWRDLGLDFLTNLGFDVLVGNHQSASLPGFDPSLVVSDLSTNGGDALFLPADYRRAQANQHPQQQNCRHRRSTDR